jgi:signal transduction histidine kinase
MNLRNQKWLWVFMSLSLLLLIGTLATTWNLVLVTNYNKMIELARAHWGHSLPEEWRSYPWWSIGLGSFGFFSLSILVLVVTVKLLREMRANQAQSEFLAHISHELKSPLATLELSSNLLESEYPRSPKTDRLWLSHRSELQRLKVEIERLLTASRWESVRDRPALEPMELGAWAKNRLSNWSAILGEGSRIDLEIPEEELWILGNVHFFDLIANNLVDNARKFSGDQKPHLEITLRRLAENGSQSWSLEFRDHGLGFESSQDRRLFKRFYRLNHEGHRSTGSGLGLYLVQRAARTLGLRESASSAGPNQGATFRLEGTINR